MGLFYQFIKSASRFALPLFFGRFDIEGQENIPEDAPYIVAPNHQNSFLDAIITGSFSPKELSFLARADVFVSPYDVVLKALQMMPIYRMRDGFEKLKRNEATFSLCNQILAQNNPVLIFPEANTAHEYYLRPLTKGAARMAFQAQSVIEQDLYVLPVGLNYGHHTDSFHRFLLIYGKPIRVSDYSDLYKENPAKALIALRRDMSNSMKEALLIPTKSERYIDQQKIYNRQYEHIPFDQLQQKLSTPESLQEETYYPILKPILWILTIPNILPFGILYYFLNGLKDPQFILSLKYVFGLLVFPLWWFISSALMMLFFGWQLGLINLFVSIGSLFIRQYIRKRIR